jgi:hypothetical protein
VAGQNTSLKFRMDEDGVFSFKFDNIVGTPTYSQPAAYSSVINPATGVVTTKAPFPANTYTGPTGAWTGNLYYVTDALGRTGTVTYSVTNVYGITISSTASVGLTSGVAANANAPTVANVYGTKTFSGTGMPTGMTINPATGALEGTPLASDEGKSFTVTVTVTDGYDGKSRSTTYTASVVGQFKAEAGQQTIWPVRIGGPVTTAAPKFENAVGTVTFSKVSGDNALGVNTATGQITALSSTSSWVLGTFPVVIRARDANARTADLTLYIKTVGPLALSTPAVSLEIDKTVSSVWPPVATNAGGPTYTATGLPSGISVDPKTGGLSGTPSVAGMYSVTMTLTDFDGAKATSTFPLVVTAPGTPHRYWKVTFKPGTSSFSSVYEVELHGADNTNYALRAQAGTATGTAGAPYQPGNSVNNVAARLWDGVLTNWYSFKPGTDGRVTVQFDFQSSPVHVEYLRYLSSGAAYPAETATDAKVFWSDDGASWNLGFEAGDTVVAPGPGTSSDRTVMR